MTRLITTAQCLRAYSAGEIGPEVVIQSLQLSGYRELFLTMARHDLPLPRDQGREAQVAREVREGLPLVRQLLGLETIETEDRSKVAS